MKSPFITRARYEADMAAKDAEIAAEWQRSGILECRINKMDRDLRESTEALKAGCAEIVRLRARLAPFDASTRRRDERGRYVGEKK